MKAHKSRLGMVVAVVAGLSVGMLVGLDLDGALGLSSLNAALTGHAVNVAPWIVRGSSDDGGATVTVRWGFVAVPLLLGAAGALVGWLVGRNSSRDLAG